MQEFFIEDVDWAQQLERDYEEYQQTLWQELEEEPEEGVEPHGTVSGEPFCGCSTCEVREQLFFLVPKIIRAYKEGKIILNEDNG